MKMISISDLTAVLAISKPCAAGIAQKCGAIRVGPRILRIPAERVREYLLANGTDPRSVDVVMAALAARGKAAV